MHADDIQDGNSQYSLSHPTTHQPQSNTTSPALTSRGFTEEDFAQVADFFDRSVKVAQAIKKETGPKIKDFRCVLVLLSVLFAL